MSVHTRMLDVLEDLDMEDLLCLAMAYRRATKKKKWVHKTIQRREHYGEFHRLVQELRLDSARFKIYFRLNPTEFEEVLELVGPHIKKQDTNYRKSISPAERLSITLRYLATGDSYRTIAFSYRVGLSTLCGKHGVIVDTCNKLWQCLSPNYMAVPKREDWKVIADRFDTRWNFPNCIGAIDGKHVQIQCPDNSGSQYFNYKKTFSIVLLAVVDANYKFTTIDVGAYGKNSDAGIFGHSAIGKALIEDKLDTPRDKPLPGATEMGNLPHVIVGDEAFPLRRNIMRPFPGGNLSEEEKIFNYRLSRARRIVENAFGILAARWRVYRRVIAVSPDSVDSIVKTTCVLHNYLQQNQVEEQAAMQHDNVVTEGMKNVHRVASNNAAREAILIRNQFKAYFNSPAGSVSWQNDVVRRGQQPQV